MQSERPLKKLMIMDEGGCGPTSPGIGNISYVKDLQTEKIVTTTFRCSTFGGYFHPSTHLGWVCFKLFQGLVQCRTQSNLSACKK